MNKKLNDRHYVHMTKKTQKNVFFSLYSLQYEMNNCSKELVLLNLSKRIITLKDLFDLNNVIFNLRKNNPEKDIMIGNNLPSGAVGQLYTLAKLKEVDKTIDKEQLYEDSYEEAYKIIQGNYRDFMLNNLLGGKFTQSRADWKEIKKSFQNKLNNIGKPYSETTKHKKPLKESKTPEELEITEKEYSKFIEVVEKGRLSFNIIGTLLYRNLDDKEKYITIGSREYINLENFKGSLYAALKALSVWIKDDKEEQEREMLDLYRHPIVDALGAVKTYKVSERTRHNIIVPEGTNSSLVKHFTNRFTFYQIKEGQLERLSGKKGSKYYNNIKDETQNLSELLELEEYTSKQLDVTRNMDMCLIDLYCELYGYPSHLSESFKRSVLNYIAQQDATYRRDLILSLDWDAQNLVDLVTTINNPKLMNSILILIDKEIIKGKLRLTGSEEILSKINHYQNEGLSTRLVYTKIGLEKELENDQHDLNDDSDEYNDIVEIDNDDYEELDEGDSDESSSDLEEVR